MEQPPVGNASSDTEIMDPLDNPMAFTDVFLMFFFIFGLVVNLLAFFVACIVFCNLPIIRNYVLNMILADLLLLITGFYLKFKRTFRILGQFACKMVFTMDVTLLHVSCYTIAMIALYRYCKLFPARVGSFNLQSLFSYSKLRSLTLLFLWLFPFLIASPNVYYGHVDTELQKCSSNMPFDTQTYYNLFTFVTSYIIPGIAVTFVYSRIILRTRSALEMATNHEERSSQANMMRFLTYVISAFWILHSPFWFCNLSDTFGWYGCSRSFLHFAIILTYVNAALNPFFYALLSVDCAECSCSCLTGSFLCEPVRCLIFLFCSFGSASMSTSMTSHSRPNDKKDGDDGQEGGELGDGVFPTSLRTKEKSHEVRGGHNEGPRVNLQSPFEVKYVGCANGDFSV